MFEQIYLFCSGVTLSRHCRASLGVLSILARLQDCQCSSRKDVNSYYTYVQSLVDQICSRLL